MSGFAKDGLEEPARFGGPRFEEARSSKPMSRGVVDDRSLAKTHGPGQGTAAFAPWPFCTDREGATPVKMAHARGRGDSLARWSTARSRGSGPFAFSAAIAGGVRRDSELEVA